MFQTTETTTTETPVQPVAPRAIKAISEITAALAKEGIRKDRRNQQQGYSFRGVEDVYAALSPLLAEYGLVILANVEERVETVRQTKTGGTLYSVALKVRFTFHHTDDDYPVVAVVWGEAMDSADKATNKAMSAAYKYMAFLTFCIPVEGQDDADKDTPPPSQPAKATPQKPAASPAAESIARKLDEKIREASKPKPVVVAQLAEPYDLAEMAVQDIHGANTQEDLDGVSARIKASNFQGEDLAAVKLAWKQRQQLPVRSV